MRYLFRLIRKIWDMFSSAITVFIIIMILNTFVFVNAYIPSTSMFPTVNKGDRIMGYRLAYNDRKPSRYDIIIFRFPDDHEKLYIKRVIGLPGDEISLVGGHIMVNGEASDESFCDPGSDTSPGTMVYPFTVPENSYFVLGDNRNNSEDSRFWKDHFVEDSEIVAKAVLRYWPVSGFRMLSASEIAQTGERNEQQNVAVPVDNIE